VLKLHLVSERFCENICGHMGRKLFDEGEPLRAEHFMQKRHTDPMCSAHMSHGWVTARMENPHSGGIVFMKNQLSRPLKDMIPQLQLWNSKLSNGMIGCHNLRFRSTFADTVLTFRHRPKWVKAVSPSESQEGTSGASLCLLTACQVGISC